METDRYTTTVPVEALSERLEDEAWVVVDVRYDLADGQAGRREYENSHIPGAVYADLGRDLADPATPGRGRHPLPSTDAIAATLGRLGIGNDAQVVAYDGGDGTYASRLWWMLRYLGHESVAVLDGGFRRWVGCGLPIRSGIDTRPAKNFVPEARPVMLARASDLEEARDDPSRLVIDSRSPDRFRGENETIDPVAGHIPGAQNHFYRNNVDSDGLWRTADELRATFVQLLGERSPSGTIVYCGSGVTACHNLLALEIAGLRGARLYAGSWSEWISDPMRPIARGEAP